MAQLIVRNIEDAVVRALKRRAASRGVSAEAEHRAILKSALIGQQSGRSFKEALIAMPNVGEDGDFVATRDADREVALGSGRRSARSPGTKRTRR